MGSRHEFPLANGRASEIIEALTQLIILYGDQYVEVYRYSDCVKDVAKEVAAQEYKDRVYFEVTT